MLGSLCSVSVKKILRISDAIFYMYPYACVLGLQGLDCSLMRHCWWSDEWYIYLFRLHVKSMFLHPCWSSFNFHIILSYSLHSYKRQDMSVEVQCIKFALSEMPFFPVAAINIQAVHFSGFARIRKIKDCGENYYVSLVCTCQIGLHLILSYWNLYWTQ
jgi:hypothetical protein